MSGFDPPPWSLGSGWLYDLSRGGARVDEAHGDLEATGAARLAPTERIGSGGMGEVHKVRDLALGRDVAKKVIHDDAQLDPRMQRRFVREARITAQLDHPHIVPVHDLGVDAGGRLYFTMKLVEGRTLSSLVAELPEGPIARDTLLNLLEIVVKICDALAFAHSRGVLHCDLKPGNVMVGEFGQVYLMDWGVARLVRDPATTEGSPAGAARRVVDALEPSPAELASTIAGTPSQMSPEQALGAWDELGVHTDVFLVGATLYQILARRAPYEGENVLATLVMAASGRFPPLDTVPAARSAPRELRRIVEQAMHPEPSARYASIEALRDDLVRLVRGHVELPRVTFEAGAVVIREGDLGDAAYRIVSGRCLVTLGEGADRRVIREMGPGESFGEMAILSPGPRTATVTALEETVLEVVTREELEAELSAMRPWMATFVRTLARRFREREVR